MNWYYISFAGDTGFLAVTIVEGYNEQHALEIAANNGLDPGGNQSLVLELPANVLDKPEVIAMKYKLLNKEQMLALSPNGKYTKDLTNEQLAILSTLAHVQKR